MIKVPILSTIKAVWFFLSFKQFLYAESGRKMSTQQKMKDWIDSSTSDLTIIQVSFSLYNYKRC